MKNTCQISAGVFGYFSHYLRRSEHAKGKLTEQRFDKIYRFSRGNDFDPAAFKKGKRAAVEAKPKGTDVGVLKRQNDVSGEKICGRKLFYARASYIGAQAFTAYGVAGYHFRERRRGLEQRVFSAVGYLERIEHKLAFGREGKRQADGFVCVCDHLVIVARLYGTRGFGDLRSLRG